MNAPDRMKQHSRKAFAIALTACALGTLAACGSENSNSSTATQSASASPARQAGILGVRVCFNNSAGRPVAVNIDGADTGTGERTVAKGERFCTEGTAHGAYRDVMGKIDTRGAHPVSFEANNPPFSTPWFSMFGEFCTDPEAGSMSVHDTQLNDTPDLKLEITRTPDGQWKNFEVYLSPGTGKASPRKFKCLY